MMPKTSLPPGFRFHPTDVEIVGYYLKRKLMGKPFWCEAISEVELYKFSPWDLPDKSQLRSKDLEWYFFCPRDRKYPNGSRMNRATDKGFWKATGRDRSIIHNSRTIGMRKTLVFHEGKPPKGNRTDWVMYEYRLEDRELVDAGFSQDAHVLCKIFQKSGPGPKIGAQYGAPFNDEDWEDDATTNISFSLPCVSCPSPKSSHNQDLVFDPAHQHPMASSVAEVSPDPDFVYADGISLEELAEFLNISPPIENANCEVFKMPEPAILDMNVNEASVVHPEGIYNELEDLNAQAAISGNINHSGTAISEFLLHPTQSELGSDQYMELNDLFLMGPSESIMPNDQFAQLPSAEWPLFQNLSNMHDPASSFDRYDSTAMYGSFHYGPDIMSQQASLSIQDEDVGDLFLI